MYEHQYFCHLSAFSSAGILITRQIIHVWFTQVEDAEVTEVRGRKNEGVGASESPGLLFS